MINAQTKSFHYPSNNKDYFYTGYIIKADTTQVIVVHVALLDTRKRMSAAVQSVMIVGKEGIIFGTMRQPELEAGLTKEYWEVFYGMVKRHTKANKLYGEVPTYLADYYVRTYDNVEYSEKIPVTPVPGMSVLEVEIKR